MIFVVTTQLCSWLWTAASGDAAHKEGQCAEAALSMGADV